MNIQRKVFRFINEPGDATHYKFYITKVGGVYFILDPLHYNMKLPYRIFPSEVVPSVNDRHFGYQLLELCDRDKVNPNTMNQVMLAIEMLERGELK